MSVNQNRFQDFFEDDRYVVLKNHLYNYLLRKQAVERVFREEPFERILEVGSGISPVMTQTDAIVYSELSILACQTLRRIHGRGSYVVADATRLPFRDGAFSHTVSSEVLEHIPDDRAALRELARVMKPGGRLVVTFPHRKAYFANDDRFVNHFRRYDCDDMIALLAEMHLAPRITRKVLGPLEKISMMTAVWAFGLLQWFRGGGQPNTPARGMRLAAPMFRWANRAYAALARFDAMLVPASYAAVLLIVAEKLSPAPSDRSVP